jgi:hypothetical protein
MTHDPKINPSTSHDSVDDGTTPVLAEGNPVPKCTGEIHRNAKLVTAATRAKRSEDIIRAR